MTDPPTPVMDDAARDAARGLSRRGGRPPAPVPGYERLGYLGRGAYGEVWVATDSNSGRKVAVKFYTRRGGTDWAALAREVEKLRYLFNSRHVVQLLRVGWDSDPPYYVMEYLENGSLEDLLRAGPLPVGPAVAVFRDIAAGLVHAHDKGVLHCDLKPGNVLLDHDRRPRLADFGQARLTHELAPALGTLFYMAPEQADLAATPDARWDVYALGAVLYRTLTGAPPHRDDPKAATLPASGVISDQLAAYRDLIRTAPPPAAHRAVPGVDAGLAAVVDRCLAADPARRFPNPQAVLTALDAWRLSRVRRPMLAVTALGFVALLVLVGGIGWVLFRDAVSTASGELVRRALDGNRFAAKSAADRLGLQVQLRWQVLESEARDPQLRSWLDTPPAPATGDKLGAALDAWLAKRKAKYEPQLGDGAAAGIWFADARDGRQYGTAPPHPENRFRYRGFRDYFHGLGRDLPDRAGPPPGVITAPHRSLAFRRQAAEGGEFWTVAFSVPVWGHGEPGGDPLGVLGLTLDLRGQTRVLGDHDREAVLVDTRPDATGRRGLLLRHPALHHAPDTAGDDRLLLYSEQVVDWADGHGPATGWDDYADPAFRGRWVAAAERVRATAAGGGVVDTGLVVVVQEPRAGVLAPVADLRGRLVLGGAVAGLVVLGTVLGMWVGMVRVAGGTAVPRVARLFRRRPAPPPASTADPPAGPAVTSDAVHPATDAARPAGVS